MLAGASSVVNEMNLPAPDFTIDKAVKALSITTCSDNPYGGLAYADVTVG